VTLPQTAPQLVNQFVLMLHQQPQQQTSYLP
jgi:hypothetical protein